ncbi:MAG: ATP-binding protein [Gammaproteobacteria bacterium]|nr:ATP-binding protein [Gammaproteobacteria bacterium]
MELLRAPSQDHLVDRRVLDFIDPRDRAVVAARMRLLNKEGKSVPALEERWRRFDGSTFYGEATAVPYVYDGCHGALVMLQDVSERRNAAVELEQARRDAEQANRAKSAFLAAMSHEIRTPMNGVFGMVEVLCQSALNAHQRELVNTIRDAATNLLTIIDDILDFSKIEAGRLELEPLPVSIEDVVEGVCGSLVPVAAAKGVEVELFVSPLIPSRVSADGTRLRQVLYNLVGNAIKFSGGQEGRQGRVRVRVEAVARDPLRVSFAVADNGIGIAPETLEQLFTPFTQAEISTTRRFGGTGLGLAICKLLVDTMGGEIRAEGAPGEGATFTATLPFEVVDATPPAPAVELTGLRCILVDHPRLEAADLRAYLEHAGARLDVATGMEEALEGAREGGPAVVISYQGAQKPAPEPALQGVEGVGQLVITRGRRRRARVESDDLVSLDGNAVRRQALVRAIAVAAGRASPEVFQGPGEAGDVPDPAAPAPSVAEARSQGRLILVAEDDEINQRVIRQQLELLGYAAEIAGDGAEALRMWREGRYALVLTDLHMPEMDGYDLARAIRQEEKAGQRASILALTANALRGEANRARAAGMDDYLTKPLTLAALRHALETWLPASAAGGREMTAAVDITVLERLVGDDADAVRSVLVSFLESARNSAAELEQAFAAAHVGRVGAVAHRLKSAAHAVGAADLGAACEGVEQAARAEDAAAADVAEPLAQLNAAREAAEAAVERHLAAGAD